MDDFFIKIYVEQVKDQIQNAEIAYSIVSTKDVDINTRFRNIYYFVLHVSNIIKIIQPNAKDLDFKKYRMKQLKIKYPNLPEIDPKLIIVRDHFEHLDERIDNWIINSEKHNYVDKNIGSANSIQGFDSGDQFRHYDLETKVFYFLTGEYPIEELYKYVQNVKSIFITKEEA